MDNKMNVIVIDPKNLNFDDLAKQLGHRLVTLNLNELKPVCFNPLEIKPVEHPEK